MQIVSFETVCMKCQSLLKETISLKCQSLLSVKIKEENITNLSSTELA